MAQLYEFCLPTIIDTIYIQQPTKVILPSVPNIVGIWKQITILIFTKLLLGW